MTKKQLEELTSRVEKLERGLEEFNSSVEKLLILNRPTLADIARRTTSLHSDIIGLNGRVEKLESGMEYRPTQKEIAHTFAPKCTTDALTLKVLRWENFNNRFTCTLYTIGCVLVLVGAFYLVRYW